MEFWGQDILAKYGKLKKKDHQKYMQWNNLTPAIMINAQLPGGLFSQCDVWKKLSQTILWHFLTFPACFWIPIFFSNLNSNCSNLFLISETSRNKLKMVFCYQNCSDLLWEKIVLVIEKKICKSFEITGAIFLKQWMVRTIFGNKILF